MSYICFTALGEKIFAKKIICKQGCIRRACRGPGFLKGYVKHKSGGISRMSCKTCVRKGLGTSKRRVTINKTIVSFGFTHVDLGHSGDGEGGGNLPEGGSTGRPPD
jgi:hypothetical protein